MTQKKGAGRPAKNPKPAVQDPATDPINNESDLDQDLDNGGDDEDDDDFDASEGSGDAPESQDEAPKPAAKPAAPVKEATQKKGAGKTEKGNFEEWMVDVKQGKADKLKKLRDNVKISEFEAETLNQGALGQVNASKHVMYFKPDQS